MAHPIVTSVEPFLTGLISLILFSSFIIISLPIYLYRFLLANLIVPLFYSEEIGNPVTPIGNIFATEFLTSHPPRCAIVTNFVVEGSVTNEEIKETIVKRWLTSKDPKTGCLIYPEFQQYIEYWMGFMFWKKDNAFSLYNHLHFYEIKGDGDEVSENFICNMMELLLNKPFLRERSPWEIHTIRNYSNSQLIKADTKNEKMTVFIIRFHHGLADGFSILQAVLEGLFETPLSTISLPEASTVKPEKQTFMERVKSLLNMSVLFIRDFGMYASFGFHTKTPWHVPDKRKKWKQVYGRSKLISIDELKELKNKLGVSLTGLLLSCIATGIAKSLEAKAKGKLVESMLALVPLPLAGHPMRLRNHVTATILELPVSPRLTSLERIEKCENNLQFAKMSTLPIFGVLYSTLIGSHLATISRILLKNAVIPMGLTSFPGPADEIVWKGRKGLSADFAAGAVSGVAGVGFMVLSYNGFIRIAVTAEKAIMERDDVNNLIEFTCSEITFLQDALRKREY